MSRKGETASGKGLQAPNLPEAKTVSPEKSTSEAGKGRDDSQNLVGVILAGGQGRRMGRRDKAQLRLGGRPLLAHAVGRLVPQVGAVMISANGDPTVYAHFGLPVRGDDVPGHAGPLAGLLTAMAWSKRHHPQATHVISVPVDSPFFPLDFARRLSDEAHAAPLRIAMAACGGKYHPVFGCWPIALAEDLAEALASGLRRVLDWTERHDSRFVDFTPVTLGGETIDPFFNINTPKDLARAEQIWEHMA